MQATEQHLLDIKRIIQTASADLSIAEGAIADEDAVRAIDALVEYLQAQKAYLEAGTSLRRNDMQSFKRFADLAAQKYFDASSRIDGLVSSLSGSLQAHYSKAADQYRTIDQRFSDRVDQFRLDVKDASASAINSVKTRLTVMSEFCKHEANSIKVAANDIVSDFKGTLSAGASLAKNWLNRMKVSITDTKANLVSAYQKVKINAAATVMTADSLIAKPVQKAALGFLDRMTERAAALNTAMKDEFTSNREEIVRRKITI